LHCALYICNQVESNSAPEQLPASPVTSNYSSDDDVAPEVLLARSPGGRKRASSEASANVLQVINEQRRFSLSATKAKRVTTGGVTGQSARHARCRVVLYTQATMQLMLSSSFAGVCIVILPCTVLSRQKN